MERYSESEGRSQHPPSSPNSNQELNPAAKRLMLSAHLSLVAKKLRRGLCIEECEILELLPFTVATGWRPEAEESPEPIEEVPAKSAEDQDWRRRIAEASGLL